VGSSPTPGTFHDTPRILRNADIENVLLQMKRDGYPDSTIRTTGKRLNNLAKDCDLEDCEAVKKVIASKAVTDGFKSNLCDAYGHFVDCFGLKWTRPRYKREKGLPRVPSTENVERIIARCSWRYATVFSVLRDTGAMPEELHRVRLRDIDLENGTISLPGCKYHKPRVRKLKTQTLAMLNRFLGDKQSEQPFPSSRQMYEAWRRARNNVSESLRDPQIKTIRLYDLRHYFGTHHYRRTQNILATKEALGHSRIETTLIYTKLVCFSEGEFNCATAKTVEEAKVLIEEGFSYVCEVEGVKLFRKPK
jgi:integrase